MFKLKLIPVIAIAVMLLWAIYWGQTPALAQAPGNDDFDYATEISALPFSESRDTTYATLASDDPVGCGMKWGATVWYRITPASNLMIEISTLWSGYTTEISVYTGTRDNLSRLNCSTNGLLTISLDAGTTYHIRIASSYPTYPWEGDPPGGGLTLNISEIIAPANDAFANAMTVTSFPFTDKSDFRYATVEGGEPLPSCGDWMGANRTVWYTFTPAENGTYSLNMPNLLDGFFMAVYTGSSIESLTQTHCARYNTSEFLFQLQANNTYYIQVGFLYGDGLIMDLTFIHYLPPDNDNFADAELISLPFYQRTETTVATKEEGETFPTCSAGENPGKSVWYAYTPTQNGSIYGTISSWGGTSVIAIYTGQSFPLVEEYCARSSPFILFQVQAGTTYYIQLSTLNEAGGAIDITLDFTLPPPNDHFTDAKVITDLPFTDKMNPLGATQDEFEPASSCYWETPRETVWYTFAPVESGTYYLVSSSTIAIFEGTSINALNWLGCAYSNGVDKILELEMGKHYYFQVIGRSTFEIRFNQLLQPKNDDRLNAQEMTLAVEINGENREATVESEEPKPSCLSDYGENLYKTVWYVFQADQSGGLYASFVPHWYGGFMAVYERGEDGLLAERSCVRFNDALFQNIHSGGIYYIQVGSMYDQGGDFSIEAEFRSPPANDNFVDAVIITSLPSDFEILIAPATVEPNEPAPPCMKDSPTNTVWYSYTASDTGLLSYNVGEPIFGGGGFVAAYTQGGSGEFLLKYCKWFHPMSSSAIKIQAGETYYIQIGSTQYDGGQMRFSFGFTNPSENDDFANAKPLDINMYTYFDTLHASLEMGEPSPTCIGSLYYDKTVWFAYTPTQKGVLNGFIESNLAIYTGNSFETLTEIFCGSSYTSLNLTVQPEITYFFQVGTPWGYGSQGNLYINFFPTPANDDFSQAEEITQLPFNLSLDNSYATLEFGEPNTGCAYDFDRTVWYTFTPTKSGSFTFWASDFYYGSVTAYTGESLSSLNLVGCAPYNAIDTIYLEAGKMYYFQVGTSWYGGGFGFHLEETPLPVAIFTGSPIDPSIFDTIQFDSSSSYDPVNEGLTSFAWDFGDGTSSTEWNPTHKYAKDGDYTVQLTVTTNDGRTAKTSQVITVRTHDIAVYRLVTQANASSGQKVLITVHLLNQRYPEKVHVILYKSTPTEFIPIGEADLFVKVKPALQPTLLNFYYTFTKEDARMGKVTFKVEVILPETRDALLMDNVVIIPPVMILK